jgi:two-component system, chemotaxis family, protein-glutamate methylesterase/glutaminase
MPDKIKIETGIATDASTMLEQLHRIGDPSLFTCPECHGTLLRIREERLPRSVPHWACFHGAEPFAALTESTEDAIWNAVRTLQEGAMLRQHLARHAKDAGQEEEARSLEDVARQKLQLARHIRQTVTHPAEGLERFAD